VPAEAAASGRLGFQLSRGVASAAECQTVAHCFTAAAAAGACAETLGNGFRRLRAEFAGSENLALGHSLADADVQEFGPPDSLVALASCDSPRRP
jgi:hypothetical protein